MATGEERFDLFARVDNIWYEDLSYAEIESSLVSEVRALLPHVEMKRQGVWMHVRTGKAAMQEQGWKIHVSASVEEAANVLRIVCAVCEKHGVHFKFICDTTLLSMVNSKMWPRSASGKFVAIYPSDDAFHRIASELDELLADYSGPHVLSDRRYGKSKCVYYRYGGFISRARVKADGSREHLIKNKHGHDVADERKAYFVLPSGVQDPVRDQSARAPVAGNTSSDEASVTQAVVKTNNKVVIDERFEIEKSLSFTAAGGVYTAIDRLTGKKVVLKEARPHVGLSGKVTDDAIALLEKEHRLLDIVKHEGVTPAPLSLCWDSGQRHRFLAEEFLEGMALGPFLIGRNPVFGAGVTEEDRRQYRALLRDIFHKTALALAAFHRNDVCMGDLSVLNIMINNWDQDLSIKLIDLEGGWKVGEEPCKLSTPGFSPNPETFRHRERGKRDDVYSIGRVMLGAFIPATSLAVLNEQIANRVFEEAASIIGIPARAFDFIQRLTDMTLHPTIDIQEVVDFFSAPDAMEGDVKVGRPLIPYHNEFGKLQQKVGDFIIKSGDVKRSDRIFPSHHRVYSTNGLSLAYGAAGVIHALHAAGRTVPEKFVSWLMTQPLHPEQIPPGLFSGTAGVAAVMAELGKDEFALSLMLDSTRHRLAHEDPFMYGGATGIGLATLWMYGKLRDPRLLEQAEALGASIEAKVSYVDGQAHWLNAEGKVPLGLLEGISGISLFLLYLYLATGKLQYKHLGEAALRTVIENKVIPNGKNFWTFSSYAGERKILRNYWADGSSGVGVVLLRWHMATGDRQYLHLVENLLTDIERPVTIMPGLLMGMSGLGMFHLEAYKALGREQSLQCCKALVEMISIYSYELPNGVGIPGEQLLRLSTDFASGSAGPLLLLSSLNAVLEGKELPSFGIVPMPDFLLAAGRGNGGGSDVN
jgi:serine/threonine protein kinase